MKAPAAQASAKRSNARTASASIAVAARPKIQDVALEAGVSLGTVSAVLNGKGRVSPTMRERVESVITQLGYHPDLYASNLARRQTQMLGLIVSNLQNPFFAETAQAMEEEAARRKFQVSLMASNFSPEQHRAAVRQLLGARIAGLAILTSEHDEPSRRLIAASGIPAVFLDSGKPADKLGVIRVDSRGGMRAAVEHLLQLGHRKLLFVRNSQEAKGPLYSHKLRHQGFAAAIRACAIEDLQTTVIDMQGPGADAGELAVASAFDKDHFTAVIAITDMVAMGVYRGLQARGLRIPQDVSVVGFDNTYFSRFLSPPLTTVDVPRSDLSKMAIGALLDKDAQTLKIMRLQTKLILRDSTAPPRLSATYAKD